MLVAKDAVITIILDHGQIDLSVPNFLDSDLTPQKLEDIAKLCKASDENHGTDVVHELLILCQHMKDGKFGLYRRTAKISKRIDKLIQLLGTQKQMPKGNKRLF